MSLSMSGGIGWDYNRFDEFEKHLLEDKEEKKCEECEDECKCEDKKDKKKSKKSKPDFLDLDKDGDKEEDMEDAVSEGIDFKGAKRIDDAREKAQAEKDKKNPSGKQRRLALGKFRPGASSEERAEGGRDSMREKGTSPKKDGKKMFEDAYAAVYGEGFEPMNKEKQAKIDRQIGRSADKEAIESGKRDRDRDDKKVDKEYQRQIAMKFQKKMKKEDYGYSSVYEAKEETEHDKEVAKHRADAKKKVDMPAGDVGHDIHNRAVKAYNKRNPSVKVKEDYGYSGVYTSNEEGEQLDELNKSTLGSYVKKASKDVEKRSHSQGEVDAEDAEIGYPGQTPKDKKIDKRQKGIGKAVDKMLKKEDYGYSGVYENRQAAYTAGESEKGSRGPAKVTGGKTIDIKDLPKLKEPSDEQKAKARKALGLTKESVELFTTEELAAIEAVLGEGLSVEDQMKVSQEYFKKRNARSPEEKSAEEKKDAKSRAERGAMHKKPDPYKARAGESD